jgi:protein involved in polysaccharide export with SLBB domain
MKNIKNPKYIYNNFTTIIYILLLAIQLNGCATTEIAKIDTRQVDSSIEDYYLRTGDILEIKFFTTPELDETLTIRPDGKISLQLIDDVRAEGLTCHELDKVLTKEYEKQLNRAVITVIARNAEGQNIYVAGEVIRPGEIQMTGKLSALQAIFSSGGFTDNARKAEVVIISRGPDNKPVARQVNLRKALKGELLENEYLLRPFDLVYIPKTRLAKTDDFTAHIYRIISPRIWRGLQYETGKSFQLDWGATTELPDPTN